MNVYQDIAERTNGDLYIGVVGPVRTGKSTFVSKFMEKLVLTEIKDKNAKSRTVDELPQSADGKTVMTTQPKFVPNEAVKLILADNKTANVRLIDCVGYLVEGAEGHEENGKQRLVSTPWSDESIPFEKAAEIGTHKVVTEHSTIAVVVTSDGTVTDIERSNYVSAEERVIRELCECEKPFVVVLNSRAPFSTNCQELALELSQKYSTTVIPLNVQDATKEDFENVLEKVLNEFPAKSIAVSIPNWMRTLPSDNSLISQIIERVKSNAASIEKMRDADKFVADFDIDGMDKAVVSAIDMGRGVIETTLLPKPELFFKLLSEEAETDITDEYTLMKFVTSSSYAKRKFDKMRFALEQADATGYGIVCPSTQEMQLAEPEMVKQGTHYGVKLVASAPTYHIIKVDVNTEVSPIVGTEQQSEYLLNELKNDPDAVWNTNMFGKTMAGLAEEGLNDKCSNMPIEVKEKLVKTLNKMVNENRGGLVCWLL